jgi:hypothetical protein
VTATFSFWEQPYRCPLSLDSENWHRPETGGSSAGAQAENADEAALIEDDAQQC